MINKSEIEKATGIRIAMSGEIRSRITTSRLVKELALCSIILHRRQFTTLWAGRFTLITTKKTTSGRCKNAQWNRILRGQTAAVSMRKSTKKLFCVVVE